MAALTGATTATTVADAVLTEMINREMKFQVQSPFLFTNFVYLPPTLQNTKRWSDPVYANLTPSVAYTETDEVTAQAITPTAVDVDTALYATGVFVGDWGNALAIHPLIPGATRLLMEACQLRLERDSLSLASSMSNGQGSAVTPMTVDNFVSVAAAFRTQAKFSTAPPVMTLSESARRDLDADVMSNGGSVYSGPLGQELGAALKGADTGKLTQWGGFRIGYTPEVLAGDTTGKANFVTHMAPGQYGLVLAFSLDLRIEPARKAERVGAYLIASHAHGAGIADQNRCYRFITKA